MCYTQILLAIITLVCSLLLILLPSKNLPWNWPLMKLLPTAYLKSHELYEKLTQVLAENKGTILCKTSWYTNVDTLVTSDPRNVQHVLNSKFSIYQRSGSEFRKAFSFLGDSVFIKDIKEWKEGKKLTHGFFKEIEFHNSIHKILLHTLEKGLLPVLHHMSKESRFFDLQNLFSRYMIDATCLMATGFDMASLRVGFPLCPLMEAMDDMADTVFWRNVLPEKVWRVQSLLGIGTERKMARACSDMKRIVDDFVSRKHDDKTGGDFDVLKFYIAGGDMINREPPKKEFLAANILTLFFAARDTSAALLTWFFYLISRNPNVKKAILEEIERFFPPKEHIFANVEDLSKLVYLHCALTESSRLFPPVPVILRDPTQEDVLPSGHRVGKSTRIIICAYAMGRAPEIWGEDCGEFRPERWMCERGGVKHVASHSFITFGSGPWACPGRELAFARMKGVAATILHNFDVEVLEEQSVSPSVSAFLNVKNGLKASVTSKWL